MERSPLGTPPKAKRRVGSLTLAAKLGCGRIPLLSSPLPTLFVSRYIDVETNMGDTELMKVYTIGYGGRHPQEFITILKENGVITLADVRLLPDRTRFGSYKKAKDSSKGVEKLLFDVGIKYVWLRELGNIYMSSDDWREKYRLLLEAEGDQRTERLLTLQFPICLLCAEKDPAGCHRSIIAEHLAGRGFEIEHLR